MSRTSQNQYPERPKPRTIFWHSAKIHLKDFHPKESWEFLMESAGRATETMNQNRIEKRDY
jgi:hypothetical protein